MADRYLKTKEAAERLDLTPEALQKRCARGAIKRGRDIVCELGDGIVAVKMGRTWRIRFPERAA
jgi:urease accessory protein UreE